MDQSGSLSIAQILSRTKKYLRPWYVLVIAAAALLAWIVFFKTDANIQTVSVKRADFVKQVSISGTVVAAQEVDLGVSAGGRISHVYANVGETVQKDAVIAEVENGDLRANVLQKQAALETQEAKLAALKNGTRPEEVAIVEAAVANDRLVLDQANQGVVNAVQDAYAKSDAAIHDTMDQFVSNARSNTPQFDFQVSDTQLRNDTLAQRADVEPLLASWQYASVRLSPADDVGAAAADAKKYLAAVSTLLNSTSAVLNRAIPSSSVSQATIDTYISSISTVRASVNAATAALNTALTTRASAIATLAKDEKTLALDKAGATPEDIAAQEAQVKVARADVDSARAQLAKTLIVAPFSGTITKMDAKVGAIVSANTPEISMISNGTFQVEVYIPEINVVDVKVGDEAVVMLDAYGPSVPFGATVISIDPAETVRDGVSTYKTKLQFNAADQRIRSGMTADTLITTAKVPDTIAIPKAAVYQRDGSSYVKVLSGKEAVERAVSTGASSLGLVEITVGLSEGDEVVLKP